jgi:hypothetical protein
MRFSDVASVEDYTGWLQAAGLRVAAVRAVREG